MDKDLISKADGLLRQARVSLLKSHSWWGALSLRLTPEYVESIGGMELGISATDGRYMYINPVDFVTRDLADRRYIVYHEMMHCAFGHIFRVGDRDRALWNIAGDIHIHNCAEQDRQDLGPLKCPRDVDAAMDTWLKSQGFIGRRQFIGLTIESIYDLLAKSNLQPKSAKGKSQGGAAGCCHAPGTCQEGEGNNEGEGVGPKQLEREWKSAVLDAATKAGNLPGVWDELIKANCRPSVKWTDYLQEFLTRGLGGDYRWLPSNRRYISSDIYLPSTYQIDAGEVAAFLDVSRSMGAPELAKAWSELLEFREQFQCQVHEIQVDYIAQRYTFYDRGDALPDALKAHGRGGTSFNPPFDYCRQHDISPRVAIYFTDGEGRCSVPVPSYPVLWIQIPWVRDHRRIWCDFTPPFGELIKVGE